jgi:hypothetical protein
MTGYRLGDWGRIFHFSISILGPIQPPQWVPGCGAHHSPPTSVLVKKMCIYTPLLHSAQLIMHRENFTLVLSLLWFSSIPSLGIPRQMLGQYLDIMLQPLSSTSFLIHNSLSYHSALFVYWFCQWLWLQHLMETLSHDSLYSSRDLNKVLNTSQAWANLLGDHICIVWATNMVEQTTTKIKNTL